MPYAACTGCILVVEDDGDLRDLLREHLEGLGCNVVVASDGVEALRVLGQGLPARPCLMLTDLNMPRLGGSALTMRVRASERDGAMPVATMSAEPGRERPFGVDFHLTKPFTTAALGRTIASLCRGGPARHRGMTS